MASDAREGLDLQKTDPPAVVIVDMQTGSAGGFALAKEMAFDARLAKIPILMLLERDQDVWLASQAGAKAIRTKPIDSGELARATLALAS